MAAEATKRWWFRLVQGAVYRIVVVPLGAALGALAGRVLRIRRAEVIERMRAAGVTDCPAKANEMYRSLGVGLVELVLCALGLPLALCARFDGAALESLRRHSAGTGLVVACGHTANWDLVACHVSRSWPLLVISKHLHVGWLDRFWRKLRARHGVSIVWSGGAASAALAHLRRGGVVVAMMDQAPESRRGACSGVFFGRPVGLDLSPALLAMRARAPLVIAFPRRLASGSYTVEVRSVLAPSRSSRPMWAAKALQTATDCLEDFVRDDPAQWLWLHRRWKPWPPDGGPAATGRSWRGPPVEPTAGRGRV